MSEKDENISGLEENTPETESAPCDQKDTGGEKEKKEKRSEIRKLKGELETANRELADLRKNLDETTDKYMRLAAEYDNFRKRTQTDRANVYGDAVSDTLTKLLPVIDNLQYAAKYSSGEPEKLAEGLAMMALPLPSGTATASTLPLRRDSTSVPISVNCLSSAPGGCSSAICSCRDAA